MSYALYLAVALSLIHGCAAPMTPSGPEKQEVARVNCSGIKGDWSVCYQKARDLCDGGAYQVLRRSHSPRQSVLQTALANKGGPIECNEERRNWAECRTRSESYGAPVSGPPMYSEPGRLRSYTHTDGSARVRMMTIKCVESADAS